MVKRSIGFGGIYGVLSTPCVYLNLENIGYCLFFVFVACMLGIYSNKVPKFINEVIENYPKVAYYLASIGWIPYFAMIGMACYRQYPNDATRCRAVGDRIREEYRRTGKYNPYSKKK